MILVIMYKCPADLMIEMNTLPLDSFTGGAHFFNVTAAVDQDQIQLTGMYEASSLIPILLFSVGIPWIEPCVKHVCCLWDVAERYKDHDLMTALGPTCDENVDLTNLDLLKRGNAPALPGTWKVSTMIHPSFVAMLFVSARPLFYMSYEILPLQWTGSSSVPWKASWYGQECHKVLYPNGQEVCIACSNPKPDHSKYVFSANWFTTFQCRWVCEPGFTGPNCEISIDLAIYVSFGVFAALCVAGMVVFALVLRRRKVVEVVAPSKPLPQPQVQKAMKSAEMIVFKENTLYPEIRIKLL